MEGKGLCEPVELTALASLPLWSVCVWDKAIILCQPFHAVLHLKDTTPDTEPMEEEKLQFMTFLGAAHLIGRDHSGSH